MSGIDHPYWTSHQGNAVRFAIWLRRRSQAASYLREIAPRHGSIKAILLAAAEPFQRETGKLEEITRTLPLGAPESVHTDPTNIERVKKLLGEAESEHRDGFASLYDAANEDPHPPGDPDALQRLVLDRNGLIAEQALVNLETRRPKDLDQRLAALWEQCPDAKKEWTDGPIHRQILFALDKLDSEVATEAIGKAILFEGKGDDVPAAVSRWAAEMYWKRRGKEGRAVFVKALDSKVEHVPKVVAKYIGKIGDYAQLQKLKSLQCAGAYYSRILLGDETGWDDLVRALAGERPTEAYLLLVELGAPAEKHLLPLLEEQNAALVVGAAAALSRVGGQASLVPLQRVATAHPETPRLQRALDDLRKRLQE